MEIENIYLKFVINLSVLYRDIGYGNVITILVATQY